VSIVIDNELKFDSHVSDLCNKANRKLSALIKMSNFSEIPLTSFKKLVSLKSLNKLTTFLTQIKKWKIMQFFIVYCVLLS